MKFETIEDAAKSVIGRILEEAAFIFTDELSPEDRPHVDSWKADGVRLDFKGNPSGHLHMWASDGFAVYAASNMLGIDPDAEHAKEKGMDALKEILNMVVGNLITELYGESPVFDLGLPTQLSIDHLKADMSDASGIWLSAEENPVLFTFYSSTPV